MADLITMADYKLYKKINSTNYDNIIQPLVPAVSTFVKSYCGRAFIDFNTTPKVEYFDGYSNSSYYVEESPIIIVTEVAGSADYGQTYTALSEFSDYIINLNSSTVEFLLEGIFSVSSWNSCRLTYTGGFSAVPEDIVLACYSLIDYYRDEQYLKKVSVSGDEKASNDGVGPSALPPNVKRILDLYRVNIG